MDTIKLSTNGHDVLFSKKSVTIDGEEYLYTGISAIKHSSAKRVYLFKYEENWHPLYYGEADATRVDAVFKKIADLNSKRAQASRALAEQTETGEASAEEKAAEPAEAKAAEPAADGEASSEQAEEAEADKSPAEEKAAEPAADGEASSEEKTEETIPASERKSKLRKAIIIFSIIIILFIGAGIAYFFVIGPANDASQGPSVDETHQYKDIQEMIDDMQN